MIKTFQQQFWCQLDNSGDEKQLDNLTRTYGNREYSVCARFRKQRGGKQCHEDVSGLVFRRMQSEVVEENNDTYSFHRLLFHQRFTVE